MSSDDFKIKTQKYALEYLKERGLNIPCLQESFVTSLLACIATQAAYLTYKYRNGNLYAKHLVKGIKLSAFTAPVAYFGTWVLCRTLMSEDTVKLDESDKKAIAHSIEERLLEEKIKKVTAEKLKHISEDQENNST